MEPDYSDLMKQAYYNRPALHRTLFKHRHKDPSPDFHADMQRSFTDQSIPKLLYWVFRGGAKSSIAEEAITLGALFQDFHNCLIVGANETRASDRLIAIRHELEYNESINLLFGDTKGHPWSDTKLVLANNIMIQCVGQGQDLRGVKYLHWRPDLVLLDDLEKREDAWTESARQKMRQWFFGELFPALAPEALIRMCATPLDAEALSVTFNQLPDWRTYTVPIKHRDDEGNWVSSWSERFPLEKINAMEQEYTRAGALPIFNREYMIQATPDDIKTFKPANLNYKLTPRGFEAVYAIYDPARTAKDTSAHTGWCVYSWIKNKLVVWESGGNFWQPSEIIDHMFDMHRKYNLVFVAVERDGLEEFILQPLRHETTKRNVSLIVNPVKAPRGKLEFIKGLQPFFSANEVILNGTSQEHQTLTSQLLNFPTGKIDVPNALAYALKLRPGTPVYEDFSNEHVEPDLTYNPSIPIYYAVNAIASPSLLTAVLLQYHKGVFYILSDFSAEGDISQTFPQALEHVSLEIGYNPRSPVKLVLPRNHFSTYDAVGLRAASRRARTQLLQGGDTLQGREAFARLLRSTKSGAPAVRVAPAAGLTLRALAGGYALPMTPTGQTTAPKAESPYTVMANGIEAFLGLVSSGNFGESENNESANVGAGAGYARTADGRPYRTAKVE